VVLIIDNYDSFTFNIKQYLVELGVEVLVCKNDGIGLAEVGNLSPSHIILSPGPCTPAESGICLDVVRSFAGSRPLLGVCLGHQCIGSVFGAKIVGSKDIKHGKVSPIYHKQAGVFRGLLSPFSATRYHSLVIESASLPLEFEVTAWASNSASFKSAESVLEEPFSSGDWEVMGIKHRTLLIEGVQFHPESIMTEYGHSIFENFLSYKYL